MSEFASSADFVFTSMFWITHDAPSIDAKPVPMNRTAAPLRSFETSSNTATAGRDFDRLVRRPFAAAAAVRSSRYMRVFCALMAFFMVDAPAPVEGKAKNPHAVSGDAGSRAEKVGCYVVCSSPG
ncbi:hypothetical protein [Paraburkholderia tropica]|uniref:hypothetical protein n=1 Tax=Paraburkholderia tropica TaxID=92647 RepID=UPI002AB6B777|nr:hypothetical protein [Paraburkholderia tropica]